MPAVSDAQRNLARAAEHGARFPMARQMRESMSHEDLHTFAATKGSLPKKTRRMGLERLRS